MISVMLALMLSFASMPVNGAPPAPPEVTVAPEQQLESSALPARPGALRRYARTIVVGPAANDDWVLSGKLLLEAIDGIEDAGPENWYLVKVLPGIYVFDGERRLVMKRFVDVEGSGRNVTCIASPGAGSPESSATVTTAEDSAIRGMTISNWGGSDTECAVALRNVHNTARVEDMLLTARSGRLLTVGLDYWQPYGFMPWEPSVRNTTVSVASSGEQAYGVRVWGPGFFEGLHVFLENGGGSSTTAAALYGMMRGDLVVVDSVLKAYVTGQSGILLDQECSLVLRNVEVDVTPSGTALLLAVDSNPVEILHSVLTGGTAISGGNPYVTVSVGASKIDGEIDFSTGTVFRCAGSFDGDYRTLSSTCR